MTVFLKASQQQQIAQGDFVSCNTQRTTELYSKQSTVVSSMCLKYMLSSDIPLRNSPAQSQELGMRQYMPVVRVAATCRGTTKTDQEKITPIPLVTFQSKS
jgi:hypothetical protein